MHPALPPRSRSRVAMLACPALLLAAGIAGAQGQPLEKMLTKVIKKDLPIEVEVSGMFEAEDKDRVAVEPQEYSGDLIIQSIIPEGTAVKNGDLLLEFEVGNVEKAITKARNELEDADVELRKANAELEALQIDQQATLQRIVKEIELAQLAVEAEQELVSFKIEEKETEIRRKENSLRDKQVNFEQLRKLYAERELHTETEKILVERERKSLEEAQHDLENLKRDYAHFKKYELNVELEKKKLDLLEKEAKKKKQDVQFAADAAEKEGAVRKAQRGVDEANKKLADLQADMEHLAVSSPRAGIVFYGPLDSDDMFGNLVVFTSGGIRQNLRVGGRVRTHETLLTVASMENLAVEMKVLENDIQHMKEGLRITVRPDAFPDLQISGQIEKVDQIASRSDILATIKEFKVKASYQGTYPQLRAGMNCRVTVHADSIPDAVQVPVVAVFEEEGRYYCYAKEGGNPVKRAIKLGASNGRNVQITEGLRPDESVYLYDPFRG